MGQWRRANVGGRVSVPLRHQTAVLVVPDEGVRRGTGVTLLLEGDDVAGLERVGGCFEDDAPYRKRRLHRTRGHAEDRSGRDDERRASNHHQHDNDQEEVILQGLHESLSVRNDRLSHRLLRSAHLPPEYLPKQYRPRPKGHW